MKKVFEGFGCEIIDQNGELYICYDSGQSAGGKLLENKITSLEAEKAMKSEKDAYEVILKAQKRKLP